MHLLRLSLLCAVSCVALSACSSGSVKNTLGLTRNSPDEFRVLPRPALSVPPQFALRPPAAPGEETGTGEASPRKQAESLVMGSGDSKNAKGDNFKLKSGAVDTTATASKPGALKGKTTAETQFLQNAGVSAADPKVRTALTEEKMQGDQPVEEKSWWDIFPDTTEKKEPIVQPSKEVERIQKNKEDNKPVNDGESPSIKPKSPSVLGTIFGD